MSTRDSLPATMTVKEFTDLMNITPRSAYRAIENGHVPVIRFGRNIIVPAHPVYAMLGMPTDDASSWDGNERAHGDHEGPTEPCGSANPSRPHKEHGAFANPAGKPDRINAAQSWTLVDAIYHGYRRQSDEGTEA